MSLNVYLRAMRETTIYSANVTHNLTKMADAAGIYQAIWRPEELAIDRADQLVPLLREGLAKLLAEPARYKALEPTNRWGTYEDFVSWVRAYLSACEEHPDALITARG